MEAPEQRHLSPPNTSPHCLSLSAPFFPRPSPRLLSTTHFSSLGPVLAGRELAWLSLQGRIVGAEEATSAKLIGGGLGREEMVAWEMFSPMQRVLLVAVVAAAAVGRKRDLEVERLRRAVEMRDELLLCMQQKLDKLCDNMNLLKEQCGNDGNISSADEKYMHEDIQVTGLEFSCVADAFSMPIEHAVSPFSTNPSDVKKNIVGAETCRNEKFKSTQSRNIEQEERRMSDLSDLFSSATSSVDIRLTLAEQQDYYSLRRECEEKDATIKELKEVILGSSVAESKRITELEDIIKRKNLVITKLRKDLIFLEQQVIHFTRIRRPSFSASNSKIDKAQLPMMSTNILYDMSSSSSPSSSDSDCPESRKKVPSQEDHSALPCSPTLTEIHMPSSSSRSMNGSSMLESSSLVKENCKASISDSAEVLKLKQMLSSRDSKRNKKHDTQYKRRDSRRRWV